jgi:hypothetical protein
MSGHPVVQNLQPDDLANLRSSGLSDETILAMGCRSVSAETIREATGITSVSCGGYSIPYPGVVDQVGAPYCRWRLRESAKDEPRYVAGLGDDPRLFIPPGFAALPPNHDLLIITEGEKKSCAAVQAGIHCVALQGTWSWCAAGPRLAEKLAGLGVSGDTPPLSALLNVTRPYRRVLVLGDSDLLRNPQASIGFDNLTQALLTNGIRAAFGYCPPNIVREGKVRTAVKQGIDDWILARGDQARRTLFAVFRGAELSRFPITDTYNGHEIALLFPDRFSYSRGVWWLWEKDAVIWQENTGRQFARVIGDHYRADARSLGGLVAMVKSALGEDEDEEGADKANADKADADKKGADKKGTDKKDPNKELRKELKHWLDSLDNAVEDLESAGCSIENVRGFEPALKMAEHLLLVPGDAWDSCEHILAVPKRCHRSTNLGAAGAVTRIPLHSHRGCRL